jgi:hypothetical protein
MDMSGWRANWIVTGSPIKRSKMGLLKRSGDKRTSVYQFKPIKEFLIGFVW